MKALWLTENIVQSRSNEDNREIDNTSSVKLQAFGYNWLIFFILFYFYKKGQTGESTLIHQVFLGYKWGATLGAVAFEVCHSIHKEVDRLQKKNK